MGIIKGEKIYTRFVLFKKSPKGIAIEAEDDKGPPILKSGISKDVQRKKAAGDDNIPVNLLK